METVRMQVIIIYKLMENKTAKFFYRVKGSWFIVSKLQIQYEDNYASHAEIILEHNRALEARLTPLTREISESRARTRTEMEELYSQLVMLLVIRYLTAQNLLIYNCSTILIILIKLCFSFNLNFHLRSGLGDPTSAKVLREAATAMQSVFPQSELIRFMKLTRFDKKVQVHFLYFQQCNENLLTILLLVNSNYHNFFYLSI